MQSCQSVEVGNYHTPLRNHLQSGFKHSQSNSVDRSGAAELQIDPFAEQVPRIDSGFLSLTDLEVSET
jgi:hypothetical protein